MKKIFCVVLLLAMTYALFSTIIYVDCDNTTAPWNGTITDPYRNIQDAVDVATNGDSIMIYDGTYIEDVDLDEFSTGTLTLQSTDPTNQSVVESTVIKADDTYAFYRSLYMSSATFYFKGLAIADSDYGIYLEEVASTTEIYVTNCIFDNNDQTAILSHSFYPVVVNYCVFYDNSTAITSTHNWTANRSCIEAKECLIYENDNGFATDLNMSIDRCTFADNTSIAVDNGYGDSDITNSILWDNGTEISNTYGTVTVSYSDIQGGYLGTSNINSDPLFLNAADDDYTLTWDEDDKSPCINTGDPNSANDPDGTRADMGYRYFEHDQKTYNFAGPYTLPHCGWTWLCFDILDITDASTTNQVQNLLEDIQDNLDTGYHENDIFYYTTSWYNGDELVISPKGYKIEMDDDDSLVVNGFRCPADTEFDLDSSNDEWTGYFLEETQHVYDAFDGYLEDIKSITHQDWSIRYSSGWPDVGYTLSPGDMVILELFHDIDDFVWSCPDPSRTDPFIILPPQLYTYTEEADYIPIYIELDENDLPDEIGIFVNDVCVGARVVQHPFENVCTYVTQAQSGNVEIEFAYYDRGERQRYTEYLVYDKETGYREITSIDLREKQDYYYVSFLSPTGTDDHDLPAKITTSNFPNPFNPTTNILFSLPSEQDIELIIYNLKGQIVRDLAQGRFTSGDHSVTWDGKDDRGKAVGSGLYLYKLITADQETTNKMLLLK